MGQVNGREEIMHIIVDGIVKAWEAGPGAVIGAVIGGFLGLWVWSTSNVNASGMLTAPVEQSVMYILVGGAIVGSVFHVIVEAVRGKDSLS